jgi:hypothetical protein
MATADALGHPRPRPASQVLGLLLGSRCRTSGCPADAEPERRTRLLLDGSGTIDDAIGGVRVTSPTSPSRRRTRKSSPGSSLRLSTWSRSCGARRRGAQSRRARARLGRTADRLALGLARPHRRLRVDPSARGVHRRQASGPHAGHGASAFPSERAPRRSSARGPQRTMRERRSGPLERARLGNGNESAA